MADADFELTIVIDAVDDASPVLRALAGQITEDFAAIAAQTQEAEVEIDRGLGSIAPLFSELALGADQVSVAFSQADAGLSLFDELLITLQQNAGLATQSLDALAAAGENDAGARLERVEAALQQALHRLVYARSDPFALD